MTLSVLLSLGLAGNGFEERSLRLPQALPRDCHIGPLFVPAKQVEHQIVVAHAASVAQTGESPQTQDRGESRVIGGATAPPRTLPYVPAVPVGLEQQPLG